MQKHFFIRKAEEYDAPALLEVLLSIDWFSRLSQQPKSANSEQIQRQLLLCLSSSSHSIYVAVEKDSIVVGYISVHWLPYLFLPGPEGFISELFIVENMRGKGIGKQLLQAVETEAKERKCSRLQLINFRERESYRRKFYEKAGWKERPDGASFVRTIEA